MKTKKQNKFYEETVFIIGALILIFPLGLFLMFKYNKFNEKARYIILTICMSPIIVVSINKMLPQRYYNQKYKNNNFVQNIPVEDSQTKFKNNPIENLAINSSHIVADTNFDGEVLVSKLEINKNLGLNFILNEIDKILSNVAYAYNNDIEKYDFWVVEKLTGEKMLAFELDSSNLNNIDLNNIDIQYILDLSDNLFIHPMLK